MGLDLTLYVGPFVEVTLPRAQRTTTLDTCTNKTCKNHGTYLRDKFCGHCGSPVDRISIQYEGYMSIYDFFMDHLKDDDMFTKAYLEKEGFEILLPNRPDKQGGKFLERGDTGGYDISQIGAEKPCADWDLLFQKLSEQKIEFKKKFGLVFYYH